MTIGVILGVAPLGACGTVLGIEDPIPLSPDADFADAGTDLGLVGDAVAVPDTSTFTDGAVDGAPDVPPDGSTLQDSFASDSNPGDSSPIDSSPDVSNPTDSNPVDARPLDASSADADANPVDSSPTDSNPMDSSPVDATPGDARPDGPACVRDLSNVGAGDFHIAFTLTTSQSGTQSAPLPIVSQRNNCGDAVFWGIRMYNGRVNAELDGSNAGAGYVGLLSNASVSNGRPHDIVVQRVAKTLTIIIDGAASGSVSCSTALGQLPPLLEGTDQCLSPLVGTIANLCITSP
jgi:hypothetical protein